MIGPYRRFLTSYIKHAHSVSASELSPLSSICG